MGHSADLSDARERTGACEKGREEKGGGEERYVKSRERRERKRVFTLCWLLRGVAISCVSLGDVSVIYSRVRERQRDREMRSKEVKPEGCQWSGICGWYLT
jgi:hypothetical protein